MRYYISVIWLFVIVGVSGQDLPDLTNYQHNWLIFNPAFAGSRDVMSVSFFSKDNAVLRPGDPAPKYVQVAIHTPFNKLESNAWGLSYFNEKEPGIGLLGFNLNEPVPMTNHNLSAYYSHKVRIGAGQLSFGISSIVSNERVDNSGIDTRQSPDPNFLVDIEPVWLANFGAGVLYYTKSFFVALSVPRLLDPVSLIDNNNYGQTETDTSGLAGIVPIEIGSVFMNYNFMLAAGNQFRINEYFTIYPSFIAGYIPSADILDMNYMASLNFGFLNERLWLGAIYKSANKIAVNFNVEIFDSKALLGFSWDFSLLETAGYFDNAFEIIIRWDNLTKVISKAPFYF
jgi:type IX secretion system PorP/SprF family membrane protein